MMLRIVWVAAAVAVLSLNTTAKAKDFVEFPFPYEGEWCGLDSDTQTSAITYVRRACDNPAGQIFIAGDIISERDETCRMISAVGLNRAYTNDTPFDGRMKCHVKKGQGMKDYEAAWRFEYNPNKTPETLTITYLH
jgi:hypothetical protein